VEAPGTLAVAPAVVGVVDTLVAVPGFEVVVEVIVVVVVDAEPAPLTELDVVDFPSPTTLPPSMTPVSRRPMKTPAPRMARRARMPRSLLMPGLTLSSSRSFVPVPPGAHRQTCHHGAAPVRTDKGVIMEQLQVTATFPSIAKADLAEFKQRASEALGVVANEPGTLQYDWFFNADETRCVVRETYASSEAVLTHLGNVGDILGPIVQLGGGLELDFFGDPSDELRQATKTFEPAVYTHFQSK
jgi:hypothetical protein